MNSWESIFDWILDKDEIDNSFNSYGRHHKWDELRDEILSQKGVECVGCGSKTGLTIHHIVPVSDPIKGRELELELSNLIVVCHKSDRFKNWSCHKSICHFNSWSRINPNAWEDLIYFRGNFDKKD